MSLDVAYSYCTNLTDQQKLEIDKQVRKNQFELKFAVILPFFGYQLFPTHITPFCQVDQVDGFTPQQIIRTSKDRGKSAIDAKVNQFLDRCEDAANEINKGSKESEETIKISVEMSPTLAKLSSKIRRDEETAKSLDKLKEQLENGQLSGGRGAKKLPGSETIFYARSGGPGRLFFRYSKTEDGEKLINIIGESNKNEEDNVIDNLKKNYK
jgi:hypothetical protein